MSLRDELVENLGMSFGDVERVIASAPARYFVFEIAKRTGGKRIIAQPARELKAIQRYILQEKLSLFPVHDCATAYEEGHSIAKNALVHVTSGPILKMDFEGFFPSIKVTDWSRFARKHKREEIDVRDIPIYSKLLFWGEEKNNKVPRCLSIGAPTSPTLSNIMLYSLDSELSGYAERLGVKYTRYADDITVSADEPAPILEFERLARRAVSKQKSPALRFNEAKRGFFTKGGRRTVTGLVITPDKKISVGRDRKRTISAMLHHLSLERLSEENKALLKGLLGFCISVEVSFVENLRLKYGNALVDQALRYHIPAKGIRNPPDID
jgi:RNA-directed DNA polymerase